MEAFIVYEDLPWLRRVRIEAGEFTLIFCEMTLPGSPVPWVDLAASCGAWQGRRSRPAVRRGRPEDVLDELLAEAEAVTAFQLAPFRAGSSFTRIQSSPESVRVAFRYTGSDEDAYTVLRLSDVAALTFREGGPPTLRTLTEPRCGSCAAAAADCWHAHLMQQTALAPGSNFVAGAVAAIASGEATVTPSLSLEFGAVVLLPGTPELQLMLRTRSPVQLTLATGVQTWRLESEALLYGLPASDIRLLAETAQRALTAMKDGDSDD